MLGNSAIPQLTGWCWIPFKPQCLYALWLCASLGVPTWRINNNQLHVMTCSCHIYGWDGCMHALIPRAWTQWMSSKAHCRRRSHCHLWHWSWHWHRDGRGLRYWHRLWLRAGNWLRILSVCEDVTTDSKVVYVYCVHMLREKNCV